MGIPYIGIRNLSKKIAKLYVGIANKSKQIKKAYVGVSNKSKLVYSADETVIITSSKTFKIPAGVSTIDMFCVGGGGGGGGDYYYIIDSTNYSDTMISDYFASLDCSGTNGGGGYTKTIMGYPVHGGEDIVVTVGAGGNSGIGFAAQTTASGGYGTTSYISANQDPAKMSYGGAGGKSSIIIDGVEVCAANGGSGGSKANISSSGMPIAWDYAGMSSGASGGSGSGAGGARHYDMTYRYVIPIAQETENNTTTNTYYQGPNDYRDSLPYYGTPGSDGSSGGRLRYYYFYRNFNDYNDSNPTTLYGTAGTGQGSTTRAWGQADKTLYSTAKGGGANTGNGGDTTYDPRTGGSGVVIIAYHY